MCMTFRSIRHERVKGLHICETKNHEIKVCYVDLEKWNNCGKIANEQIFITFKYLFMDFILLWHKIT